jgi:HYR domain
MKTLRTVITILIVLSGAAAEAATFTVTNTAPSGAGSLQQAIIDANASGGLDTIAFGIGPDDGMVKTIIVTNLLPIISGPTIIDGYTQSGSSSNTLATGNNAVLLIEVTATNSVRGCFDITGAGSSVRGLIINGFYDSGFQVGNMITLETAASNCVVEGNFIGTDPTGTNDSPRVTFIGVKALSPGNRIGGTSPGARNVFGGCTSAGINLTGAAGTNNTVQGNYIGTDKTGTKAIANGTGINVDSSLNLIGGIPPGAGNLISGNSGSGISITSASTNVVEGNLIGLAITGASALPNGNGGIFLNAARFTRIGSAATGGRNVISGNLNRGIIMSGSTTNRVLSNFIGTDSTGSNAVPNAGGGIHVDLCIGTFIGGNTAGEGNVIAGNTGAGISFTRGSILEIDGNHIGTDLSDTLDLGNSSHGIDGNSGVSQIDIGVGAANTIAFNGSDQSHAGITLNNGANSNNIIGNLIFTNAGPGVLLTLTASYNHISENSIFDNGGLGITIGNGVILNDLCDTDAGYNGQQNYPVITAANSDANSVTIAGFLDSAASTAFDLEFFANTVCDPTGYGEGEFFLGNTNVTTGADCTNNFVATFPFPIAGGLFITATATDPNGNTSEFSACFTNQSTVVVADCSLAPMLATNTVGEMHIVTATVTSNSVAAGNIDVTFNLTGANGTVQTNITTDGGGHASFTYTGLIAGTDNILAAGGFAGTEFACNATKVWISATNLPPVAVCQSVTTNADVSCQANLVAADFDGGSIDNDGTITDRSINPTGPFAKGIQQVILTVTDNDGASASCTTTVTVVDNTLPSITCHSDITSNVADGVTNTVVQFGPPTSSDNCPGLTTNCVPPSGSTFDLGTNIVTCTAIDASANTNSCSFNVIVTAAAPNQPPVAQCRDNTVSANAGCQANVPALDVDAGSFDPDGSIVDGTLSPAGPFALGTNNVTLTVFDNQGASNSCDAQIIVIDTTPPTIGPCATITTNVAAGVTNAVISFSDPTSGDNCDVTGVICVPPSDTSFALGATPVTCTVTDTSGNTNSCIFDVTVQETAPEVHDLALIKLKAPKNINLKAAEPSLTKFVKVTLQNRSPHDEMITDLTGLVTLVAESLSNVCPNATVLLHNGPPNKTKTLKPKQKLTVTFDVTYNCANDPAKGAGHEDFRYLATVNHAAIDGNADTHTADDNCPRAPLPDGTDPNPDPNKPLKDKGCGNKDKATGQIGAPVLADVFEK